MEFCHDQEFLEDGKTIELISIGILAGNGQEYYAENLDVIGDRTGPLDRLRNHPWLMANVVPSLSLPAQKLIIGDVNHWSDLITSSHPVLKARWKIAAEVQQFFARHGAPCRDDNQLRTWYGSYDHVSLAQLFGPMISLPPQIPMYTNDLKPIVDTLKRGNVVLDLPAQPADEHNALSDARWIAAAWNIYDQYAAMQPEDAWTAGGGLVTIPTDVFVGMAERMLSVGPNEGLSDEDEKRVEAVWRHLL